MLCSLFEIFLTLIYVFIAIDLLLEVIWLPTLLFSFGVRWFSSVVCFGSLYLIFCTIAFCFFLPWNLHKLSFNFIIGYFKLIATLSWSFKILCAFIPSSTFSAFDVTIYIFYAVSPLTRLCKYHLLGKLPHYS
jgi:hypothetical protein